MRTPMIDKEYEGIICRGSYVLGTACGHCERCADELESIQGKLKIKINLSESESMCLYHMQNIKERIENVLFYDNFSSNVTNEFKLIQIRDLLVYLESRIDEMSK